MLRRFTINDENNLVDRDGAVLGKVTGLTVDMPSGGKGVSSSVLGNLPQVQKDSPLAPGVDEVWAYFVQWREKIERPIRNKNLSPSYRRLISKGLKEVEGPGDLMRAIDGLGVWITERGGKPDLGRILRTYPGGRPLVEQIEFFIEQSGAAGTHGGTQTLTPEEMVKINRLKEAITSGYDKPHRQEEVAQAISQLEAKGWKVEVGGTEQGQLPRFLAP